MQEDYRCSRFLKVDNRSPKTHCVWPDGAQMKNGVVRVCWDASYDKCDGLANH